MLMEKNGPIYEIAFKLKTLVGILSSRIINQVSLEKCKNTKRRMFKTGKVALNNFEMEMYKLIEQSGIM